MTMHIFEIKNMIFAGTLNDDRTVGQDDMDGEC